MRLGTSSEPLVTLLDEVVAGVWKVKAGRPGMLDGTVRMTLAVAGTGVFIGALNVAATVDCVSAVSCKIPFVNGGAAIILIPAAELLGGSISIIQPDAGPTAGRQDVVEQDPFEPPVLAGFSPAATPAHPSTLLRAAMRIEARAASDDRRIMVSSSSGRCRSCRSARSPRWRARARARPALREPSSPS